MYTTTTATTATTAPTLTTSIQGPPLLLTRRLTALLYANLTPQIHSTILATPSGKLLAHASPHPVAQLRAQAAAAASLCAIHAASATATAASEAAGLSAAGNDKSGGGGGIGAHDSSRTATSSQSGSPPPSFLRPRSGEYLGGADDGQEPCSSMPVSPTDYRRPSSASSAATSRPESTTRGGGGRRGGGSVGAITVQLAGGTVVIRRLRCGVLFICIGGTVTGAPGIGALKGIGIGSGPPMVVGSTSLGTNNAAASQLRQSHHGSQARDVHAAPASGANSAGRASPQQQGPSSPAETTTSGLSAAAITATSFGSSAAGTAGGVAVMRRQAEEMARWLDDKLGALRVPEEGIGVDL